MHVNYEYLLDKCAEYSKTGDRILDYGCGKGSTIEEGINRNFDIFGVEAFSHGSGPEIKKELVKKELFNNRVKELASNHIPFPDSYFDIVVSNQVFEHVVDIEAVLQELNRVLKPGGKLLCLFPSKEVIREVHCGVPFAHRMCKSRLRYYWLLCCRTIGLCRGRANKRRSNSNWAAFFNDWLAESVTYRSIPEITTQFSKYIGQVDFHETDYIAYRLRAQNRILFSRISKLVPISWALAWTYRRLGGLTLQVSKPG